ncbi:MAG: putative aminoacrylate hydrolase RutD [Stenotrophomonas maltophilia]|uniref:Putative aminoacrylate hydrolase RutD n=1 Tax=Stenotrophomonas maltophilia TaxID=40324 RepID=A0A7V8FJ95_STEMA|nr:MAG: putative aminoacrylate hydrolase RutD [Stenotrophomonas maltophilia]
MTKVRGWRRVGRWLKWALIGLVAVLVLLGIIGAIYEALQRRQAETTYPPHGTLVDIGGRLMHIDCRGTGSPTVILESGLGTGGTLDWARVHDRIAGFTRTCAYDRAGIMHSPAKDTPQRAGAVADDLHALLAAAGIDDPLVLVGHSIGGPYIPTYAGRYGQQVAGLVMVDPSHPDQVARLGKLVTVSVHPRKVSLMLDTVSLLSRTGIVRLLFSRSSQDGRSAQDAAHMAAYASLSIKGAKAEIDGFDDTMDDARAVHDLGDRPLIVLTALKPFKPAELKSLGLSPAEGLRFKQEWRALHAEQAAMSRRGRQQIVGDLGHYIQIDQPDRVVAAVREVVDDVRAGHASPQQSTGTSGAHEPKGLQ